MLEPLRERRHAALLLHGVTGSGKTEVYLRAAQAALEQGRTAIVMVPEIALTPQTARRFEERFGDRVAILHSKLGLGERYDEWQRLRSGAARICVGPRSAVFAPLDDLGLVVLDEEHDAAYKQESDPRYDARDVAERRARLAGAVLLAGSATPRPESWLRMPRLSLPQRVDDTPLPPVELLDMRGLRHALHPDARRALEEVRERQKKAIVLVARRGWSPFVDCSDCGRAWMCRSCDVSLTLHRDGDAQRLICHHCGHTESPPHACPDCGSTAVARHGVGTQRLEVELREALAPLPVFRLDADAGRRKGGIASILRPLRLRACRHPRGHPDGRSGARLPGRGAGRRPGRRRQPAVPRLPGRGAHVLARRPAGRPQRSRAGGRAGAGPDAVPVGTQPAPRRRPRRRRRSSRRRWSAGARCAIRPSPP